MWPNRCRWRPRKLMFSFQPPVRPSQRRTLFRIAVVAACVTAFSPLIRAQVAKDRVCPRPQAGSIVEEPEDLRSQNGVLDAELTANNAAEPDGSIRYCFTDGAGRESPNLRVSPGDLVILHLKNELKDLAPAANASTAQTEHSHPSMLSRAGDSTAN